MELSKGGAGRRVDVRTCHAQSGTMKGERRAVFEQPGTMAAFRKLKLLAGGYFAISALALAAIALMSHYSAGVNSAVWTHGILVTVGAGGIFGLVVRAARGSRGAYRRLRIASAAVVVAIAVIIALPGSFPLWMKAEEGIAGLFMIGVAVLVNHSHLRSLFAAKPRSTDAGQRRP